MTTLYGIANCDSIKKARRWLNDHHIEYQFHDYKKQSLTEQKLQQWVQQVGWEILLNKRSTSWRKLDEQHKISVDEPSAIQIMLNNPSIIKRPVLDFKGNLIVGFKAENYEKLFA